MTPTFRCVVVPGTLALLPEYAGLIDPIAPVRAAAFEAVDWLVEDDPTAVCAVGLGAAGRIAARLVERTGFAGELRVVRPDELGPPCPPRLLVVADGSARRTQKAPGHLDARAVDFDTEVEKLLVEGDLPGLAALDVTLGEALLATGVPGLRALGRVGPRRLRTRVDYTDDPYGVQYWVVRGQE